MWSDPGAWIVIGISLLFIVVGIVMHRVFVQVLKQGSEQPEQPTPKAPDHV